MATELDAAPKDWRGRFYEDFDAGDVFRSRLGRTVTQTDNIWFTCLTLNTNQVHFNAVQAERGLYGQPLVNSRLHARAGHGHDRSGHERERRRQPRVDGHHAAEARVRGRHALGRERDPRQARIVVDGRTSGIVSMRCRGINQRREVVIEFKRTFMVYKRDAPEVQDTFPGTDEEWTV